MMELVSEIKDLLMTSLKGIKKVKKGQKKVQVTKNYRVKRTKRKQWTCDRRPWKRMVELESVKILKEKMTAPKQENQN